VVKMNKSIFICILLTLILLPFVFGQDLYVEKSFIDEVPKEFFYKALLENFKTANSRELRLIFLEYIEDDIIVGYMPNIAFQVLEYICMEGTNNIIFDESGQVINNFPEVRRKSAAILGRIGTEEAKNILILIIQYENDPIVLQEAQECLRLDREFK